MKKYIIAVLVVIVLLASTDILVEAFKSIMYAIPCELDDEHIADIAFYGGEI